MPFKRERCYDNIKITRNAHDSNFCAVNPKFVAIVTEVAGGGAFLVLPLDHVSDKLSYSAVINSVFVLHYLSLACFVPHWILIKGYSGGSTCDCRRNKQWYGGELR